MDESKIVTLKILGHMYWHLGYIDKAERFFKGIARLCPEDRAVEGQLAAIDLARGRHEAAVGRIEKLMDGWPLGSGDYFLWLIKARALWGLGRQAEARTALDEYLNIQGSGEVK